MKIVHVIKIFRGILFKTLLKFNEERKMERKKKESSKINIFIN